jgi:outer membrane protein assembly factor BamB
VNVFRASALVFLATSTGACGVPDAPATDPETVPLEARTDSQAAKPDEDLPAWPQWGQNARHTGSIAVNGQRLRRNLVNVVYDPLVPEEVKATGGDVEGGLFIHYQVPLVDDEDVFMMFKGGPFDPKNYATQTWGETRFSWKDGKLVRKWDYASDWKAPGGIDEFWEPVFHPVLANDSLYVPGAGGTIIRVDRNNGQVTARINPFPTVDPSTFTVSPLTADRHGNIYYNVLRLGPGAFYDSDPVDSWLVKVSADDEVSKVSYSVLTPDAPKADDQCSVIFSSRDPSTPLPWPPSLDAKPRTVRCSPQRVGLNVAPAVAPDGTIYSLTRPHQLPFHGFLVAVNGDLTPRWTASLDKRLHDGCGVPASEGGALPPDGTPGGCRVGARRGVDPTTNEPGGGWIDDSSSATPTVAPDGTVLIGTFTLYNYLQGHLLQFSSRGKFRRGYGFGWDTTAAIWKHDSTYSIVLKENHYNAPSYCFNEAFCPADRNASNPGSPEAYYITQLSPKLDVEWQFQATNQESCARDAADKVTCTDTGEHTHGFEWCVNAAAVDAKGTVYANSEDGFLYAVKQGGHLRDNIFQQLNLGAAYTPASLGGDGKVYSQNAGHLFVVGR